MATELFMKNPPLYTRGRTVGGDITGICVRNPHPALPNDYANIHTFAQTPFHPRIFPGLLRPF
ncbi:hypothetical protein HMPREF9374_0841 [Desmospora sp. 8437]|nr:hypothetical protein HMPREF9374_0841 [Desmospora sp. 8437]